MNSAHSSRGVSVCAPAKINLFLHVGDRRDDGYHSLESLVVFTEAGDRIECFAAERLSLTVEGPFADAVPKGDDNLILRAASALAEASGHGAAGAEGMGARIHLEKNLPVAAGIGGGSADAAATLRALNLLWQLNMNDARLLAIAATLGSDVPACLMARPLWMSGRGEVVCPVPALPSLKLILINPRLPLETPQVFARLGNRTGLGAAPRAGSLATTSDLETFLFDTHNDLQAPAAALVPEIALIVRALQYSPSCRVARMSGSGPTCFGLFDWRNGALFAAEAIATKYPNWWVRVTRIASPDIGAPHWMAQ